MNRCSCFCFDFPFKYLQPLQELGLDDHLAEVSILTCRVCGELWLRYYYELEAFTGSGRWYLGPISPEQRGALTLKTAKSTLGGLDWYYYGGSYYAGLSGKASGPIAIP